MAVSIEKYMSNLKKAIKQLPSENKRIVLSHMDEIIDYNRENQLFEKGIDTKGEILGVYRGFRTRPEPNSDPRGYPKLLGQRWNFLDSGNFFNSLSIVYRSKWSYEIVSNGIPYFKELEEKTGSKNILGLSPESLIEAETKIIKPNLDKWLKRLL